MDEFYPMNLVNEVIQGGGGVNVCHNWMPICAA